MNRDEIESLLPHRDPFLLLDGIEELEPGVSAVGVKHVRDDEFWVPGHFPGEPVMPGVLIAEALAQVAGVIFTSGHRDQATRALYLLGFDKLRFRKPVRPGDTLRLTVTVDRQRRGIWTFDAVAHVGEDRVCNGSFLATVAKAP